MSTNNPCMQYNPHKGTPTGNISEFGGVRAYITASKAAETASDADLKAVVILVADIFGIGYAGSGPDALTETGIADCCSQSPTIVPKIRLCWPTSLQKSSGPSECHRFHNSASPPLTCMDPVRVYVPDFFDGHDMTVVAPTEADRKVFDFATWIAKYDPRVQALPILQRFVAEVKKVHPSAKVGAVGYCYGAKPVLHVGSSDVKKECQVDAVAFAHGSKVVKEDFDLVQRSLLVIMPEKDHMFTPVSLQHHLSQIFKTHPVPGLLALHRISSERRWLKDASWRQEAF